MNPDVKQARWPMTGDLRPTKQYTLRAAVTIVDNYAHNNAHCWREMSKTIRWRRIQDVIESRLWWDSKICRSWLIPMVADIDSFHGGELALRLGAARGAMPLAPLGIGQASQRGRRAN